VQALLSSQQTGVKIHCPDTQASDVQKLLSLHTIGVYWHPLVLSQLSTVHGLLSLQVIGVYSHPSDISQESVVHAELSLQVT
jgi:hypothetical protein